MLTHCYCLALALALAAVWPGHATARDASGFDRFRLFNECRPMRLVVEEYDNDAPAAIWLTEARIRTLAESRLRAARGPAYGGALPSDAERRLLGPLSASGGVFPQNPVLPQSFERINA